MSEGGLEPRGAFEKVAARLSSRDLICSSGAAKLFEGVDEQTALLVAEHLLVHVTGFIIEEAAVREAIAAVREAKDKLPATGPSSTASEYVVQETHYKPLAKEYGSRLKLHDETDITGKSQCTGTVEDFVGTFRDRLKRIKGVLKNRMTEATVIPISSVKTFTRGREARIIGMVYSKNVTKNGHLIVELEDEEGIVSCLISKKAPIREKADEIILDEVLAFDGTCNEDLFIVKDIVWPEVPINNRKKTTDEDVSIAFLSDIHVGSKLFLKESFTNFINFLNGKGTDEERAIASKIKYLTFAGDLVDGIGVYPEQEKELAVQDIYTQYEMLGEFLKQIPEYIEVTLVPGNHDACRAALPQPRLGHEFTKSLDGFKNVHFIGNPGLIDVHDFKVRIFHGSTMYSIMDSIPRLRGANMAPDKMAVEMLRRRLMHPIYGVQPLAPEKRDYAVMEDVPDIFHFGDIHRNAYAQYNGTFIVNSGCWQGKTGYQVKLGHHPTPCNLPVYNLQNNSLRVLDFTSASERPLTK